MSRTILVTGPDLHPGAASLVSERGYVTAHTPAYASTHQIAERLRETQAVAIVSRLGRLDATVIAGAPHVKVIAKHGVGVDNIDLAAAAKAGIPVLVATGANAVSVGEHAIALLLSAVKSILPLDASLREGRWEKPGFAGRELAGGTLGLLGMGAIALATARIARGLDLQIVGHDPFVPDHIFESVGADRAETAAELFARSDFLSLHCPLTDQTRGIVNAEAIATMPDGAYVVNTARGGLIDEHALLAAIRSGKLAGAGLDTFAVEPPAADHPFWAEPRITVTPHIGGVTRQANARVGLEAVRGIFQVLDGAELPPERIANRHLLADDALALARMEQA